MLKNCLISRYGKCKCLEEAIKLFNDIELSERNVVTWSTMIYVYGEYKSDQEALRLFKQIQREAAKPNKQTIACVSKAFRDSALIEDTLEILFSMKNKFGIKPDNFHYSCMLNACAENGLISLGERIYYHLEENNFQDSIFVKNNLMKMYGRCECLDQSIKIFNSIKICERDLISCTTMIIAYGQNGKGKEASELFE
jgi:pentatricopeptide repeat protein